MHCQSKSTYDIYRYPLVHMTDSVYQYYIIWATETNKQEQRRKLPFHAKRSQIFHYQFLYYEFGSKNIFCIVSSAWSVLSMYAPLFHTQTSSSRYIDAFTTIFLSSSCSQIYLVHLYSQPRFLFPDLLCFAQIHLFPLSLSPFVSSFVDELTEPSWTQLNVRVCVYIQLAIYIYPGI